MTRKSLKIGTRGSPLALAQAALVRDTLLAAHPDLRADGAVEIVPIVTKGDRIQGRPLAEIGGKGLFTEEIEEGLLEGALDLAVHSMKDMPTRLPDGLTIGAMLARADPRDVLIGADGLDALPRGALVGSASLRRKAQLLAHRPDLEVVTLRGNVQTRLRKLQAGEVRATLLARAGLDRLGLDKGLGVALAPETMLPAVGQGAIGIECRARDEATLERLRAIDHSATHVCVRAERAFLDVLDGSCRTPIAAFAETDGATIRLRGLLAREDGGRIWRAERQGAMADALAIGRDAGREIRAEAGSDRPV